MERRCTSRSVGRAGQRPPGPHAGTHPGQHVLQLDAGGAFRPPAPTAAGASARLVECLPLADAVDKEAQRVDGRTVRERPRLKRPLGRPTHVRSVFPIRRSILRRAVVVDESCHMFRFGRPPGRLTGDPRRRRVDRAEGGQGAIKVKPHRRAAPGAHRTEPDTSELVDVRVDPLPADTERSCRVGGRDQPGPATCGRLRGKELGDACGDRFDVFGIERHGPHPPVGTSSLVGPFAMNNTARSSRGSGACVRPAPP